MRPQPLAITYLLADASVLRFVEHTVFILLNMQLCLLIIIVGGLHIREYGVYIKLIYCNNWCYVMRILDATRVLLSKEDVNQRLN